VTAAAETTPPVPAEQPAPTLPYAPERRTEIERLKFAADVTATFCCEAYGDPAVTRLGGMR
jgi:hypothetical protein